jgi:hypothetical protein
MHTPRGRALLWQKPKGFAASHCMRCKAGWTRSGKGGSALTVCLLDREPVLLDMTDCDRYEPSPQAVLSAPPSARGPVKPRKVRPLTLGSRPAKRKAKRAGAPTLRVIPRAPDKDEA